MRQPPATHRCAGSQVAGLPGGDAGPADGRARGQIVHAHASTRATTPRPKRALIGFAFGARAETVRRRRRRARRALGGDVGHHRRKRSPGSAARSRAKRRAAKSTASSGSPRRPRKRSRPAPATALVFLGFFSLALAILNLFPFLPLDGGHMLWSLAEKVRGKRISLRRDVPLQLGRDPPDAVPGHQRLQQRHRPPGRLTPRRALRRATLTQLLTSGPRRSARAGPNSASSSPRESSSISSQPPRRAEPPVAPPQRRRAASVRTAAASAARSGTSARASAPSSRARRGAARRRRPRAAAGGTCSITLEQ